jgi:hypothetical protein
LFLVPRALKRWAILFRHFAASHILFGIEQLSSSEISTAKIPTASRQEKFSTEKFIS